MLKQNKKGNNDGSFVALNLLHSGHRQSSGPHGQTAHNQSECERRLGVLSRRANLFFLPFLLHFYEAASQNDMSRIRERRSASGRSIHRSSIPGGLHGVSQSQRHRRHEHHERLGLPGGAQSAGNHGRRVNNVRAERLSKRSDRAKAEE